jgi:hypothetical protein
MPQNIETEPSLAPFADSHAEKAEKIRSGKGVAGILGGVAALFLAAFTSSSARCCGFFISSDAISRRRSNAC